MPRQSSGRGPGRPRKNTGNGFAEANEEQRQYESNTAARRDIIQAACREIAALESERDAISEQIREVKTKRIKGDLDMKLSDFAIAMRLYRLEGDDRDECLDTIRECFMALGAGQQGDFLVGLGAANENEGAAA